MSHARDESPPGLAALAEQIQASLGLELTPVGFGWAAGAPAGARRIQGGCIAPLFVAAGRGTTFALTPEACGWPCAAFHLGFADSIRPGIEQYLSHGLPGEPCERFLETPELARTYCDAIRWQAPSGATAVIGPLAGFSEPPAVVVLMAGADALGGLVYLLHHRAPLDERVVTRFASACGSVVTLPLRLEREGHSAAVWGFQDPSARERIPGHLMSLSLPWRLLLEAWRDAPGSFLGTERWARFRERSAGEHRAPGGRS